MYPRILNLIQQYQVSAICPSQTYQSKKGDFTVKYVWVGMGRTSKTSFRYSLNTYKYISQYNKVCRMEIAMNTQTFQTCTEGNLCIPAMYRKPDIPSVDLTHIYNTINSQQLVALQHFYYSRRTDIGSSGSVSDTYTERLVSRLFFYIQCVYLSLIRQPRVCRKSRHFACTHTH